MKVGRDIAADCRRAALIRDAIGPEGVLMMDANQYWGVEAAIVAVKQLSASFDDRIVEWVDHLHEHFRDPAVGRAGRYLAPTAPGYSIEILSESLDRYEFPDGPAWRGVPPLATMPPAAR